MIPTVMPIATIKISNMLSVQHKNLQQQLLLLFGGLECITGKVRLGKTLSDLALFPGTKGLCGASTS